MRWLSRISPQKVCFVTSKKVNAETTIVVCECQRMITKRMKQHLERRTKQKAAQRVCL